MPKHNLNHLAEQVNTLQDKLRRVELLSYFGAIVSAGIVIAHLVNLL